MKNMFRPQYLLQKIIRSKLEWEESNERETKEREMDSCIVDMCIDYMPISCKGSDKDNDKQKKCSRIKE